MPQNKWKGLRTMNTRFMSNTPYADTESEMQLIPGFAPRKSGMSVSRFAYNAEDCDCSLCAYKSRKKECIGKGICVCLRERLVAGCVPLDELFSVTYRRGGGTDPDG